MMSWLIPGPLRRLRLSVSVAAETAPAESIRAPTASENAFFCMSHLSSYRPRNKQRRIQLYAHPLANPDHIPVTHCHKRTRMSYLVIKCLLPHRRPPSPLPSCFSIPVLGVSRYSAR